MKKSVYCIGTALFFLILAALPAETFRFIYREGDNYRINSIVTQRVYINRRISHSAEINNRIKVSVVSVDDDGSGEHEARFMTTERTSNRSFSWGREYESRFSRNPRGRFTIDSRYFMPVVRDVPVFPEHDVAPGERWKSEGQEAHDLRDQFGLAEPFTVPFTAEYTYVGRVKKDGKTLHHIQVEYNLFSDTPEQLTQQATGDYPATTMGYSRQNLYWNNEEGFLDHYTEEFRIQMQLASGTVIEFRGEARAEVTETELLDRERIVREMNDELNRLGIADTRASSTAEGITITLENIQFEPDSARLMPAEKEKITTIAALLERYPDKELLITGHTALAGTAAARKALSEERAEAVARFLVEMGVRNDYNVYTRGMGAEQPVAPNDSERNRAKNRRVEITILEQ